MRSYYLLVILAIMFLNIQAQRVSNLNVIQEGQKLHIQYELISTSPVEVGLFISENNGSTWTKISQHLSGDVGPKVSGGSKELVWDVLQARESLVGNSIVFKVKAGSEIKSVKIGNQVWMAENLNVDHYRNGDPIPTGLSNTQWESTTQGAYAIYNDDPANEKIYGKLYNWYAVNDSRGLCPSGWHVPSEKEWDEITNYLGGDNSAGGKMKSASGWKSLLSGGTNSSGFSALPGGFKDQSGKFRYAGSYGFWWSRRNIDSANIWDRELYQGSSSINRYISDAHFGFSVRCIKD